MILIDDRVGSQELAGSFPADIPTSITRLNSGDFAFPGHCPHGEDMIGVERKVVSDLLASFYSGRLAGLQLPNMIAEYGMRYLIVEGPMREDDNGRLMVYRNGWVAAKPRTSYHQIWSYLTSIENLTGTRVRHTANRVDTVSHICQLWEWHQKPWDKHKSLKQSFTPCDTAMVTITDQQTLRYKIARQLPGIGSEKGRTVEKHFHTVWDMITAGVDEWLMPGIGKPMAERIWKALRHKE